MNKNIVIAGVGGQGTLLASRVIGHAALSSGLHVKLSEVHGMSQRGGSVVSFARLGDTPIASPVIAEGAADVIMAFEPLEAYRSLSYIKPGGVILMNTRRINPMPVNIGAAAYPDGIIEKIKGLGIGLTTVDAQLIAGRAGNEKAVNIVMIGMLAAGLGMEKEIWTDAIKALVPERFKQINLNAFEAGYEIKGEIALG